MLPEFRVMFADVKEMLPFDTIDVHGLEFNQWIGKDPTLSCSIPISTPAMAARVRRLVPGRTAVWVTGGGHVWWGGILWTRSIDAPERGPIVVQLGAGGFGGYLPRVQTGDRPSPIKGDQMWVAAQMVREAMATPGCDIGILIASFKYSGVQVSWSAEQLDQKTWGEEIDKLANAENGFEWYIEPYLDHAGNWLRKRLVHQHPKIDRGPHPGLMNRPGNIVSYKNADDASSMVNAWMTVGSKRETNLVGTLFGFASYRDQFIDGPYPKLEGTSTLPGELPAMGNPGLDFLEAISRRELAARNHIGQPMELTIRPDATFTPTILGRWIRVRITDLWHDGYQVSRRVIGWQLRPGQRGQTETATLYLEAPLDAPTSDTVRPPRQDHRSRTAHQPS